MSEAAIGYGSQFKIGDGASPEQFTAVAEVKTITPPGFEMDEIDVTHLESPNRFREVVGSIKDATEVKMTANATSANLTALYLVADGIVRNFLITSNAELNMQWPFSGFVKSVVPGELSNDGALEIEITVRVSGSVAPEAMS